MALVYVDDLLGATHESAKLAEEFVRRFGAKLSPPGSMCLGLNYKQNLLEGWISISFLSCLERTMERLLNKTAEEIGLRSLVGILMWLTLHIFATHLVEVKALARRTNQNLPEDGKTALALIYELHERRGQAIYYRRLNSKKSLFVPTRRGLPVPSRLNSRSRPSSGWILRATHLTCVGASAKEPLTMIRSSHLFSPSRNT